MGRAEVYVSGAVLSEEQLGIYESWISRRKLREPVQRILGHAYFRYLKLGLNKASLVPRSDTESVVDAALEVIDLSSGDCKVLDLGTGSGAIAISIAQERPYCEVNAVDNSPAALEVAQRNAKAAGVNVSFYLGDLLDRLEELHGEVSLLVSNPPYIKSEDVENLEPEVRDWDPRPALDGGRDGLDFYRRIFSGAGPFLKDEAYIVLEVGDGQSGDVLELGQQAGLTPLGTRQDLTGAPRVVLFKREGK